MTDLEKAEIVLASFRGEKECQWCHRFFPLEELVLWSNQGSETQRAMCVHCWSDMRDAGLHPMRECKYSGDSEDKRPE